MSRLVTVGAVSALVMVLGTGANAWAQDDIKTARGFITQGKFAEAITVINKLIKDRPEATGTLSFDLGRAYFGMKAWPQAEAAFGKVIEAKPMYAEAYFNRGAVRVQNSNWAGALTDFSKVIELNPKPKENGPNLVLDSYDNRIVANLQLKKFAEAIQDANKVLEADPKRGLVLLNRGFAYEQLGQFDKAVADYDAALKIMPNDAQTYFSKADLEFNQLKQTQAAVDDYTKGLALDKTNTGALLNRAAGYFQLKNFAAALADLNGALGVKPGDPDITKNRAAVHMQLKDYKSAIVDYSTYISKAGAAVDVAVYRLRAASYLNVDPKNYPAAVTDLKAYLANAKNASDASAWSDLAIAQYKSIVPTGGTVDKSQVAVLNDPIASATKATQLDPKQASAFLILGDSYGYQDKLKEAASAYSSYIALKPEDPIGYELLGRMQYDLKDYTGAKTSFEKYLKLKPDNNEVKKLLALVNAFDPNATPAAKIAALTDAINSDPKDPVNYTNRGVAYFGMGDFDKALLDFKKALELKPGDMQYLNNLASAAGKKADKTQADADFKVALDAYTQVLAKAPTNVEALGAQAFLSLKLKQWDTAIAAYTKYLATNPADQKEMLAALNNRAYCALQKTPADFTMAIADYTKIVGLTPTDPKAYEIRARAYFDQKNMVAAATDFEKVLQLTNNQDMEMVKNLAAIYFNLGEGKRKANDPTKGTPEFDKSIALFTTYLGAKAGDATALYGRGFAIYRKAKAAADVKVKLAELKKAIPDFDAATKADAKNADAWYYLAVSCDDFGVADELSQEEMFKKAIDAYEKFIAVPGVAQADIDMAKKRITELKDAL